MNEAQFNAIDTTGQRPINPDLIIDETQTQPRDEAPDATSQQQEEATRSQRPEQQNRARSSFVESGNPREELELDSQTEEAIKDRFKKRAETAEELRDNEKELSVIDRMVLREGFIERINSGRLTKEDIALGWYMIGSDLIETQIAAARLISSEPGRLQRFANFPLLARLQREQRINTTEWRAAGTGETISEYATRLGLDTWSDDRIIDRLTDLQKLQDKIETSFYKHGNRNPVLNRLGVYLRGTRYHEPLQEDVHRLSGTENLQPNAGGLTSADRSIVEKSGLKLNDEMLDQAEKIVAERIRTGALADGTTLHLLALTNPVEFLKISHEATEHALAQKARNGALEILSGETRKTDETAIRRRAEELQEAPKTEEIEPLEQAKTQTQEALTEAESALGRLKTQLSEAEQQARTAGANFNKAEQRYDAANGTIPNQIARLQAHIDKLNDKLLEIASIPVPAPAGGKGSGEKQVSQAESLRQTIKDYEDRVANYERELRDALIKKADAEVDKKSAQNHLDRLRGKELNPGPPPEYTPGGEIEIAENRVSDAKSAAENAEQAYKDKQSEVALGGSKERKDKSIALIRQVMVSERRGKIHEELYSHDDGGEFTIKNLSDSTITQEGEVAGLESVRKLIFQTIDKEGFTPEMMELTRKMISNESFARAMIEHFGIDLDSRMNKDYPETYGQALEAVGQLKERANDTSLPEPDREAARDELRAKQQTLASYAVGNMTNMNRVQIGSFINFLINKGLTQAEMGNPYLTMVK